MFQSLGWINQTHQADVTCTGWAETDAGSCGCGCKMERWSRRRASNELGQRGETSPGRGQSELGFQRDWHNTSSSQRMLDYVVALWQWCWDKCCFIPSVLSYRHKFLFTLNRLGSKAVFDSDSDESIKNLSENMKIFIKCTYPIKMTCPCFRSHQKQRRRLHTLGLKASSAHYINLSFCLYFCQEKTTLLTLISVFKVKVKWNHYKENMLIWKHEKGSSVSVNTESQMFSAGAEARGFNMAVDVVLHHCKHLGLVFKFCLWILEDLFI